MEESFHGRMYTPFFFNASTSTRRVCGAAVLTPAKVGVPYLKRKLDDAYENFAGGSAANLLGPGYRREELPETVQAFPRSPPSTRRLMAV